MRKCTIKILIVLFLFSSTILVIGCSDNNDEKPSSDIWDIEKDGIPKFVETNYIELNKIYRISKFRSSIGHDYSDFLEDCRSMKHYFEPKGGIDWSTVKVYAPITGEITRVDQEWAGIKIEIMSDKYPAFRFSIFHINTLKVFNLGDKVVEGEQLGTHIGSQTMSDISVIVNDPTRQGRMISYFDVMKDEIFAEYLNYGVASRDNLIISKELRDANPIECSGDMFISVDLLECWVVLIESN